MRLNYFLPAALFLFVASPIVAAHAQSVPNLIGTPTYNNSTTTFPTSSGTSITVTTAPLPGTTAGTYAAGNDPRITNSLQAGSDISSSPVTATGASNSRTLGAISYDELNAATLASAALPKSGGTISGTLSVSGATTLASLTANSISSLGSITGTTGSFSGNVTVSSVTFPVDSGSVIPVISSSNNAVGLKINSAVTIAGNLYGNSGIFNSLSINGNVVTTGLIGNSSQGNTITANSITVPASGTAPTGATTMYASFNVISSCSSAAAGSSAAPLQLPAGAAIGYSYNIIIVNRSGNTCLVYPPAGGTIENSAANVPVSIASGYDQIFRSLNTSSWYQ